MSGYGGRGGGDFADLRDTFVTYLLTVIVKRMERQEKIMMYVSAMINSIERLIMRTGETSRYGVKARLAKLTEPKIIRAILVVAGDERGLQYFIYCANNLSYQIMRPSPRLERTKQLFNDLRNSWRIACAYHQHNWENILQLNSSLILQEVPLIKSKGSGIGEFMARVKNMASGESPK